ncbi:RAMP superfamily CRISPR-associated protein, partial [Actinosynnema sp. NPDC059797]
MKVAPAALAAVEPVLVRTLSDWRVGTGRGVPGDLDAVVRRDGDGLPYLPGTSLTGVLREACWVVALALDDGAPDGVWQRWHTRVFGTAPDLPGGRDGDRLHPALLGLGPARLAGEVRDAVLAADAADSLVTRRVGVAIDQATGRAVDAALRMVQVARAGLDLHAQLTLEPMPQSADARTAVTALLVSGAAWCTQVGADRRRGLGRVAITVGGHDPAVWARWLADSGFCPPEPAQTRCPAETGAGAAVVQRPSGGWMAAELVVTVNRPLRVPVQAAGNIVRSLDHVPGSLLVPWLAQRWGQAVVDTGIWHRALIVRNAFPEVAGQRGVPAPLSLYASRDDEHLFHLAAPPAEPTPSGTEPSDTYAADAAVPGREHEGGPPAGSRQVRGYYTTGTVVDGRITLATVPLLRVMHNAVDPDTQRPTSATGVFEVEAIPAGTRLRGRVLVRESLLASVPGDAWELLSGPARWGARRRGEYGAVTVAARPCTAPVTQAPAAEAPGGQCVLWAVSDVVVRDRTGRLTADPARVAAVLADRLGTAVELVSAVARTRRRDGWQGRWQLPRDSIVG